MSKIIGIDHSSLKLRMTGLGKLKLINNIIGGKNE